MWWKWARAACLIFLKHVTGPVAFLNIEGKNGLLAIKSIC